jgi:hypothetical protein
MILTIDDGPFDGEVIDLTVLEARASWAAVSAHDFDDETLDRLLAAIVEVER